MIPEKDVYWDGSEEYGQDNFGVCNYDHASDPPYGICIIPTDEQLLTQGTVYRAISSAAVQQWFFTKPVTVDSAQVILESGHTFPIPISETAFHMSTGDDPQYLSMRMPMALNWADEQALLAPIVSAYPYMRMDMHDSAPDSNHMTFEMPLSFTVTPEAPTSLTAKRTSSTSASISWHQPAQGYCTYFNVKRTSASGTWQTQVGETTNSFSFTHLTAGQTYSLSVQCVADNVGNGVGPVPSVPAAGSTTALAAAGSVTAKRTGQGSAAISWSAPATLGGKTLTGYKVARDGTDTYGGGAYSKVVPASTRSFTMNYLKLGSTYKLSVQPVYSGGAGPAVTVPVFIG